MIKVTKNTVKSKIRKEGKWEGRIVPSLCYPNVGHPFDMSVQVEYTKEMLEKESPEDILTPLEISLMHFSHYNCTKETGERIHFYET